MLSLCGIIAVVVFLQISALIEKMLWLHCDRLCAFIHALPQIELINQSRSQEFHAFDKGSLIFIGMCKKQSGHRI